MTYLFDFDGTLVDSMPVYVKAMLRILDENNIGYDDSIIKTITPLGLLGAAKYYVGLGVNKPIEEIIAAMKKYMYEEYLYNIPAKKNVISTLESLKDKGASLNVLTASPHVTLDPCLKRLGMYDIFDNVWSCDDFSTTKSDPEIYKMVAERLGKLPREILFVDDNIDADKTAKSAGLKVYGIYDKSSEDYIDAFQGVVDKYIYDFSELIG